MYTRSSEYYLNGVLATFRRTINKFEVSAGNAIGSGRTSAAKTVWAAWTTEIIHNIIVMIDRAV